MRNSLVIKLMMAIFICLPLMASAMSSISVSESSSNLLSLSGIKDSYPAHSLIEIEVHNDSDEVLFFYCAVEKKIEGNWREVVPSVEASKVSKAVELKKISPNQSQKLIWNRDQQEFYHAAIKSGAFRFRIEIIEEREKKATGRISSQEFEILD
jgi:hypothetical protein